MAKFLKLTFSGEHSFNWNGTITNQKIESDEEKKSKIKLIQVGEINSFPSEATPGLVMLGVLKLSCLNWSISITPSDFIKTADLIVKINDSTVTLIGSILVKVNLKDNCLIDFENNPDKLFFSEINIWNVESYLIRNSYLFTITGNWAEDNKIWDSIQKGIPQTDRELKIEIFKKLPK